uniref:Uncharacterized protein n=1 Tax=Arundo donax TaxID=35708 RepID=A0A0A9GRL0_ARUDO
MMYSSLALHVVPTFMWHVR